MCKRSDLSWRLQVKVHARKVSNLSLMYAFSKFSTYIYIAECISARESRFEEGLNTKVQLNGLVRV